MLKSRLPELTAALLLEVKAAVDAGAEIIAEAAKAKAPVESGRLRDAIHVEHDPLGASVKAGDQKVFYGRMVEFGTVHSPPHPFLVPATEESRGAVQAEMIAAIRRAAD